jgi:hypothetical protein
VTEGTSGSECLNCHERATGPPEDPDRYPAIVNYSFNKHQNVNISGEVNVLDNSDCIVCHYNISGMDSPGWTTPTMTCMDCHIDGSYQAPIITNHRPGGINIITGTYCATCHNNSINRYAYSGNASVGHYGTNTSLIKPTINQTPLPGSGFMNSSDASAYNKECNNCHKPSNKDYGNATLISVSHTSKGTCNGCHVNDSAPDLHNSKLGMPETYGCKACHTTNAEKYGAPNIIGTTMGLKNPTSCEGCHGGGGNNGYLDSLSKHNIDRNENGFTGYPGRTGTVYLNNQIILTVTKGTVITVNSSINDTAGQASRVGGAEYYFDIDPGIGKGTPMDAADGYYNAVNTNWENVTGTIDTSSLSVGTYKIYVRGMDIGKQWSAVQSATLTVLPAGGYINGTVRDNNTKAGISGAKVTTDTGVTGQTNGSGSYLLYLDVGIHNLTVTKEPEYYPNSSITITVVSETTVLQDIELSKRPLGNISGTVRNT